MLARFERAVERIVEGSIAGVFRLRVQPAEIGRRLERAMLDGRVTSVGTSLAPNLYEVRLHPEDAAAFTGWEQALSREMETWLAEFAFARGLSTVGPIQVRLVADASVGRRSVQAEGRFAGGAPRQKKVCGPIVSCPGRCDCCLSTLVLRRCRSYQAQCVSVAQTTTIWCLPIRKCPAITRGWNRTARVGARSTSAAPTEPGSTACV